MHEDLLQLHKPFRFRLNTACSLNRKRSGFLQSSLYIFDSCKVISWNRNRWNYTSRVTRVNTSKLNVFHNGRDVNMCFYIEGGGKSPPSLQPASRSSATPSSENTQQGPMIGKLLVQFAILPCPSHSKRFTENISCEQATKSCTAESILCCLSKKQYYQEAENYF